MDKPRTRGRVIAEPKQKIMVFRVKKKGWFARCPGCNDFDYERPYKFEMVEFAKTHNADEHDSAYDVQVVKS